MVSLSKKQAKDFFDACDTDNSGSVSIKELVLKICGSLSTDHSAVIKMFNDVDKNDDDQITEDEFINEVCREPREKGIESFFNEADTDGSNTISKDELENHLESFGGQLDAKTMKDIFAAVDSDGSGTINREEFKRAMAENY